ncbi:DUF4383 domain-containing protein [Klenkia taihuensis]|uniref:DUF4383 domain-containing protein n=1 Tax=Klenkia taihuensis TaxID=1225127 RepID=A0A1I1HEZ0_9ACTN|nr:DUF4383 domain-containing protein [Klenkia taihuensis]GHE09337.1 hypothetical protein GCM10011381_13720 [Klenkia taihuensis]SFC20043.1 protein of unknown function [Klenkia taihuensis]
MDPIDPAAHQTRWTWPQLVAGAVGAVYLLVGVVGFVLTGFSDFFDHTETLLGFMVTPLHNTVHVVVGLAGLALASTLTRARVFGWLLAIGYGATFVYGLFAVGQDWDPLGINTADNWLHGLSALLGLVIAFGPVHRDRTPVKEVRAGHRSEP